MIRGHVQLTFSGRLLLLSGFGLAGFGMAVGILALLERAGLPNHFIAAILLGLVLTAFALCGIAVRTMNLTWFVDAGRRLPPDMSGMAAAADWLPGAALVTLLGGLALDGSGLAWLAGWIGGLVLMLALVAPSLRRSDAASVPDYLAARFGGWPARLTGLVVLLASTLLLLVAEVQVIGQIGHRFFGPQFGQAMWLGLGALVLCAGFGGLNGVVRANALAYVAMLMALLIPGALLSSNLAGTAIPHFALSDALAAIRFGAGGGADPALPDRFNTIALTVAVMTGVAAFPHMLGRYLTLSGAGGTRRAVVWSILFLAILVVTVPVVAALGRWQIEQALIGLNVRALPVWVFDYGAMGLVRICGSEATNAASVVAACSGSSVASLDAAQLWIDPGIAAMLAPRAAGLPFVVAALLAAGILVAAMATVNGLLLALATTAGGGLQRGLLGGKASGGRRLLLTRLAMIAAAVFAAWAAARLAVPALSLLAWSLNLAAAGLFPALVLGLWWPTAGRFGGLAGMIVGFTVTLFYIVEIEVNGMARWGFLWLTDSGVDSQAAAVFGLPAGLAAMIAGSLLIDRRLPFRKREPAASPAAS